MLQILGSRSNQPSRFDCLSRDLNQHIPDAAEYKGSGVDKETFRHKNCKRIRFLFA